MNYSPIVVFLYFLFESFLLSKYGYVILAYHSLYIAVLHAYLSIRNQNSSYHVTKEAAFGQLKQQQQKQYQLKQCPICIRIKPSRYYHCRRCDVCIYRMDHHCQWIGNCVGQYNCRPFLHYLLNLFIHNIIVFVDMFVLNILNILTNNERSFYLLILLIPVSLILFETQRLLRDFYQMVRENKTLIESYKLVKGRKIPLKQSLSQFLGTKNILLWFIPVYFPFQNPQKSSNLLEISKKVSQNTEQPQQLTFADQYMYGKDDQNQNELIKQAKYQ